MKVGELPAEKLIFNDFKKFSDSQKRIFFYFHEKHNYTNIV